MKGYLWVYDGKITKTVGAGGVNLRIVPAKQQIMKVLLIGIQVSNLAAPQQVDAYLQMNPDDNGVWEFLFKRDMDNELFVYPAPDDIGQFGSISIDRIYLADEDDLVITILSLGVTNWIRINVRAIISDYALPTLEYQYSTADKNTTNIIYQNKIRGVIE